MKFLSTKKICESFSDPSKRALGDELSLSKIFFNSAYPLPISIGSNKVGTPILKLIFILPSKNYLIIRNSNLFFSTPYLA